MKIYIKEFLKNLTVSMRKREIVFWGLLLSSLIYKIPEFSIFLNWMIPILVIIMSVLIGYSGILFMKNNFSIKRGYPIDIPEIKELAQKIGIELSPQPFWENDKKKMTAMSLGNSKKSNRIIFGKDFLSSLTSEEKVFVAGHEFLHLYGHEYWYYLLVFIPIIFFGVLVPIRLDIPDDIMIIGFLGGMAGGLCLGKRSFEFIADINGAANVSKENAINALKKAYFGREEKSFYLHPSLKTRIRNLDKYYQQK